MAVSAKVNHHPRYAVHYHLSWLPLQHSCSVKKPQFMHYGRWMEIVCQITGFFYLIYKTVCTEQGCRKGNQLKCKCIFRFFSILCSNDYESYDHESTAIDDFVGTVSIVFFLFLVTIEDNKGVIRPRYVKCNKEMWEKRWICCNF